MLYLKHGGHIVDEDDATARDLVKNTGNTAIKKGAFRPGRAPETTPFDYLLFKLKERPESRLPESDPAKTVTALNELGTAMVEATPPPAAENSIIPAIYTYWGQFIDHDLTANTDRDSTVSDIRPPSLKPIPPAEVVKKLANLRRPTLDLDSVYGEGPAFFDQDSDDVGFYDGARFRIGTINEQDGIPGVKVPPVEDKQRDLPRIGTLLDAGVIKEDDLPPDLRGDPSLRTRAFIGDLRNDENLIVAQFHLAVMRFHNRVVDQIEANPQKFGVWPGRGRQARLFLRARQLVRFHYQWLVVNDYLPTVTLPGIVDKVLRRGPQHYRPLALHGRPQLFAPLEFSVAAYRFGHSMVRGGYDHNRNFGKRLPGQGDGAPVKPFAPFDDLFTFTGGGFVRDPNDPTVRTRAPFLNSGPTLPFNWVIEWDRFSNKSDPDAAHFARKIDTRLAGALTDMLNEGAPDQNPPDPALLEMLRHLARRNLLRGYHLSIPTGQAAAKEMGVTPLTEEELRRDNSDALNAALERGGFLQQTPLWYYVLKEAEVRANGNSLGELGSRIVCETFIGLLSHDPNSFVNQRGWGPEDGVTLENGDPIVTIRDFLTFAGLPA